MPVVNTRLEKPVWIVNETHESAVMVVDSDTLKRVISEGWMVVSGPDVTYSSVTGQRVVVQQAHHEPAGAVTISDTPIEFDSPIELIGLPPEPAPEVVVEHHATETAKATAARNANAKAWVGKKA